MSGRRELFFFKRTAQGDRGFGFLSSTTVCRRGWRAADWGSELRACFRFGRNLALP